MIRTPYAILQECKKLNYIKEENNKFYVTKYFENIIEELNRRETETELDLAAFGKKEFTFEEWKEWVMASG